MVVISVYTYGVKIIKKFRWESGFLWGGSMEPPRYALTEVRGTLCSFNCIRYPLKSVKITSWHTIIHNATLNIIVKKPGPTSVNLHQN